VKTCHLAATYAWAAFLGASKSPCPVYHDIHCAVRFICHLEHDRDVGKYSFPM
jgi:hypothetical protein